MLEQHKLVVSVREESSDNKGLNGQELPLTKML